jgi:hypothetical protein
MTLDPRDRKSWHGLFDVFQPPSGYRLSAALGTSFGLSLDAIVAALLAMGDADPDSLASEPLAGVMAATRLGSRVRVLVHPGTISGPSQPGSNRFVALLDRMIVDVKPSAGLFHPKVWALSFEKVGYGRPTEPQFRGRLVVSSRNLGPSRSFELGTVLDGQPASRAADASPFSIDVAEALANWLTNGKASVPTAVQQLPAFTRSLQLDIPSEAAAECRLRWQGGNRRQLAQMLPARAKRALVVSPFVQPDFVRTLAARADELQLVGTQEALDALDEGTVKSIESLAPRKGLPALYYVTDLQDPDDPEDGYIDGVHAKLLIVEEENGESVTFVGSANATGPGWGLSGSGNVEAMVEMRPGIAIDRFVSAFIRESKARLHPWIAEYDRSNRTDVDPESEMERLLLRALREVATLKFTMAYDGDAQELRLAVQLPARAQWLSEPGCEYFAAPLLLSDLPDAWAPFHDLALAPRRFGATPVERVTSFVAIRATSKNPPMERTRLALARLELSEEALDQRDDAIRHEIIASADPAAVLNALVKGLAFLPAAGTGAKRAGRRNGGHTLQQVLADASLERLLQAVALQPDLVHEMRQLLGSLEGPFRQLCDDLEHVVARVRNEATS